MIKITLKDGVIKEVEKDSSILELVESISSSLKKSTVVAKVDGELVDLNYKLTKDATVEFILKEDQIAKDVLNHSTAHLLAHAIKRLYPQAKFWVGPLVETGFYYDIDLGDTVITEADLVNIEKEMKNIQMQNIEIQREEFDKTTALEMFKDDEYKVDLINNLPEGTVLSFYGQSDFKDLCRGPHVKSTGLIQNFKLLKVAGAYFKGDANNKMLQRIYGISFFTKDELKDHLFMLEEAKKRDHRKLGRELELFMISDYGPGFPFFLNNGMILRKNLENFWYEEHTKEGYEFIQTPIMLDKTLWEKSGHWFNYRENMYTSEIDEREFAVKPMNCPGAMLVYSNSMHSYKDFPLRVAELGLVHRHEASGALSGLFRVRNFTQDDAHIFMTEDQIESEIVSLLAFIDRLYKVFGLTYHIELSTRPLDKFIGEIEVWDKAELALANACKASGTEFIVNEGDGAFYGPKLDIKIKDSLKRIWQCATIQLDMNLPERFDLTYVAADGTKKRPIMLHRAIFGSIERFLGIIIEHYAGAFPMWLAPKQIKILPVSNEAHLEYCNKLNEKLNELKFRSSVDDREEKLSYKIREAQTHKIPYQLVIGDNEIENNQVTYRKYGSKDQVTVTIDEFIELITNEVLEKSPL